MLFKSIMSNIKQYYAVPAVFMAFGKGFTGGFDEYVKNMNNDVTLVEHTVCCIMGTYMGLVTGAFLGITWPISLPIFIGRYLDKK
jgi:hypothetical protein